MESQSAKINPIKLEVLWSKLRSIPKDMGTHLERTAFTPVIKYANDFSTGLFSWDGRLLSQGIYTAGHLGSLPGAMKTILDAHYDYDEWDPGDLVMTNNPYIGAGHLPDVFMFEPVFVDDRLAGFSVTTGHHVDFGGPDPGSYVMTARDMFGEGLLIPPVKLREGGETNEAVLDIVMENSRAPDTIRGDLRAQLSATDFGADRYRELVAEEGFDTLQTYTEEILERTETRMRNSISELPDGSHSFDDYVDAFEETGPLKMCVEVTVDGDEIIVDFEGTADELFGYSINSVWNYTLAYTMLSVKAAVDPDTPQTHSTLTPIEMRAPENCLVNPSPPAPVALRHITMERIVSVVSGALHEIAPEQVPADGGQFSLQIMEFKDAETGHSEILHDGFFSGAGARPERDGYPAVPSDTNVANFPIEVIEVDFPVTVNQYEIVLDTAGAGRYRGGPGTIREMAFDDDAWIQCINERCVLPPYGLDGGEDGHRGKVVLNSGTDEEEQLSPKARVDVEPGDVLRVHTPGGGGYGDPADRDRESIVEDVENGIISRERAAEVYGVDV